MQITIDLPDTLQISETDLRTELAIALFQQQRITLGSASQLAGLHQIERPNFPFERPVQPSTLDWRTREKQFFRPPEIAQPLYSHRCLALVPK
jgi:Uncharacterised protein family (UPF0175)